MSMKFWPSLSDGLLPCYFVELDGANFTAPIKATWNCRARGPTEAVVAVLRNLFENDKIQPNADVRYQVWLEKPKGEKRFELTGAIDSRVVEDYLTMYRPAEVAPPKLYTALLAHPRQDKNALYWMTLQARTPTEAFIVARDSSDSLKLGFTEEYLFSIYEGWKRPRSVSEDRELVQIPSVYMHGVPLPERPKRTKDHAQETTPIFIDWHKCYEEFGVPMPNAYEEVACMPAEQKDVSNDINLNLLNLLRNLHRDWVESGARPWPRHEPRESVDG